MRQPWPILQRAVDPRQGAPRPPGHPAPASGRSGSAALRARLARMDWRTGGAGRTSLPARGGHGVRGVVGACGSGGPAPAMGEWPPAAPEPEWIPDGDGGRGFWLLRREFPLRRGPGGCRLDALPAVSSWSLGFLSGEGPSDPADCLFLDLETTGLGGGAGTLAFLVGCAYIREGRLMVQQFFLPDFPQEPALLSMLAEVLDRFSCLVTFNGKSFDLPLLQNRFTLAGRRIDLRRRRVIDLLHVSRVLWRRSLGSCSLAALERCVLGVRRRGDIDSRLIPAAYFAYLRRRVEGEMRAILDHNAWDLLASAGLLVEVDAVLSGPVQVHGGAPAPAIDSRPEVDHVGLARALWRRGEAARALQQAALGGGPEAVELERVIRRRTEGQRKARVARPAAHPQRRSGGVPADPGQVHDSGGVGGRRGQRERNRRAVCWTGPEPAGLQERCQEERRECLAANSPAAQGGPRLVPPSPAAIVIK